MESPNPTEPGTDDASAAARIARGVSRHFAELGQACLLEFSLKNGRRADVIAIDRTGAITIIEIKSSRVDFVSDSKWTEYLPFCDRFYFAVAPDFPSEILPDDHGLIIADAYGAEIQRESQDGDLHASRRKTLTLRFARTAGQRVMRAIDPGMTL